MGAGLLVYAAVTTSAAVRYDRTTHNPVTRLAAARCRCDAHWAPWSTTRGAIQGQFGDEALVRLEVRRVDESGRVIALREPVLVFAPVSWLRIPLGATLRVSGHLAPATRR